MSHLPTTLCYPTPKARVQSFDCIACLVRQAREAVLVATRNSERREAALREVLQLLAGMDWQLPPPALAQQVHRLIRDVTGNPDPYAVAKKELNGVAQDLISIWRERFHQRFSPLESAVRLAIVGNLLDVGAKTQMNGTALKTALEDALSVPLWGSLDEFQHAVQQARNILYLTDNAGEIIFDRDLLSLLSSDRLTIAVRGEAVLNDATLADARLAGLQHYGDLISSGSDAPGILIEDCSVEFQDRFADADLVVAKGQGNYEGLAGINHHVCFLLNVKCEVLACALNCPVGSLVLHRHRPPSSVTDSVS